MQRDFLSTKQAGLTEMAALAPIPVMLFIGWLLRVTGIITGVFIKEGNKVVYYVALPALIIVKFVSVKQGFEFNQAFISLFVGYTCLNFVIAFIVDRYFDMCSTKKIPFIVGSFRGSVVIFSLATLESLVSGPALSSSLFAIGIAMALYNIHFVDFLFCCQKV